MSVPQQAIHLLSLLQAWGTQRVVYYSAGFHTEKWESGVVVPRTLETK